MGILKSKQCFYKHRNTFSRMCELFLPRRMTHLLSTNWALNYSRPAQPLSGTLRLQLIKTDSRLVVFGEP